MLKLHNVDTHAFLRDHWQKRPLLMRGALPGFEGWLDREQIVALAGEEATPSRFVATGGDVIYGPLDIDLRTQGRDHWTVLVQSLETVFDEAWALLDVFDFLPRTNLDDVMVSYASAGGGVGPHVDLYGVFLVQARGQRRWQWASAPLTDLNEEAPLAPWPFEADHDEVLDPGDVLYLPPRVPHDGVALAECVTYSVGAAAPRYADVLAELLAFMAMDPARAGVSVDGLFEDPAAGAKRAGLPSALAGEVLARAQQLKPGAELIDEFLGRLLTAPKPHTLFDEQDAPDLDALRGALKGTGTLRLTPPSRMLVSDACAYLNGQAVEMRAGSPLLTLAERREVELPLSLDDEELDALALWMEAGFLRLVG